jgi:hypothetical protein
MSQYGTTLSAPLSADVNRRLAATLNPATGMAAIAGAAAKCLGIFVDDVTLASGEEAGIQVEGVAPCIYGGAASYLDSLMTDAAGRMVTAAGAAGAHVWCLGLAVSPGTQAGDLGDILLAPHLMSF